MYHLHAASQHEKMMVQLGECPMLEPIKLIPTSNRHLHKFGVVFFVLGYDAMASMVSRSSPLKMPYFPCIQPKGLLKQLSGHFIRFPF